MRVCLPCSSCCTPGQVGEDNFSTSNCIYPNRKAGEAQSRRQWHSPFPTAVLGSNKRRGTMSCKPHISVQLYSGLEAAGSCWYDPSRTKHLNRPNGWRKGGTRHASKSFTWSASAFPVHEPRTSVWERQGPFACSHYTRGVQLVPQFWPTVLPTNSNFTLQNLFFIEAIRTKKELLQWVFFLFFQTLRIRNKNVQLFYTV